MSSTAPVSARDPSIVYEGRCVVEPSGAVRLAFPGVRVHLRFRGQTLSMRANASDNDVCFDVEVDGAPPRLLRLAKGEGEYSVVRNETAGEHSVTLTRRTESWQGTCAILNFSGAEALLAPPALPKRKLMFIGDSVTCGEKTSYLPTRKMDDRENSNARLSYGMLLAHRFDAQCHLVSYGGRGIIRDWQGIRDTHNAPQFYELALPDDATPRWDHHQYVPDAVGIQLGTNDFNQGVPDQNEFVNAYVEFIQVVRRDAPNALIFVMDSPIVNDDQLKGPRRTILHYYLQQVVARSGSPKVILAPLSVYHGVPGNGHPTGEEHAAMARELEPILQRELGW